MNRIDFMNQLESLLQNISSAEREEAIQYYNDYFDDAGAENEQSVIEALGNPAKVAENIKRDLYGSGYGEAVFQQGIANDRAMVEYRQDIYRDNASAQGTEQGKGTKLSTGMIVLIVILCIFASPILISVASGVLSLLIGLIMAWFGILIAVGITAVAFLIVMCVLIVVGVMTMFSDVLVGILLLGIGMILGGIGLLFLMLTVAMAGIATPAICKGVVKLFRMIFRKPVGGV